MKHIEIVRAMLAEHANEDTSEMTSHERAAVHARRWTFEAVITALEQSESAPRLEWKRLSGDNDDRDIRREVNTHDGMCARMRTTAYSGFVSVRVRGGCNHPSADFEHRIDRLPDEGEATFADRCERIAELVIARHRGMLAEIAGVK